MDIMLPADPTQMEDNLKKFLVDRVLSYPYWDEKHQKVQSTKAHRGRILKINFLEAFWRLPPGCLRAGGNPPHKEAGQEAPGGRPRGRPGGRPRGRPGGKPGGKPGGAPPKPP